MKFWLRSSVAAPPQGQGLVRRRDVTGMRGAGGVGGKFAPDRVDTRPHRYAFRRRGGPIWVLRFRVGQTSGRTDAFGATDPSGRTGFGDNRDEAAVMAVLIWVVP